MRHAWLTLSVGISIALTTAAPAWSATTVRVLTDADVPVNPANVGDHDTVRVTPLYGGSDRSAYTIDDEQRAAPAPEIHFVLADFPAPPDMTPGDVLQGMASAYDTSNRVIPAESTPRIEVALAWPDGRWTVVGHADVRGNGDYSGGAATHTPTPVRVPVPFDPAHRPRRVRVTAVLPNLGASVVHLCMTVSGLRLSNDGPSNVVSPPTVETPAWPTAGLEESVIRRFRGNDFDAHLSWGVGTLDTDAPVIVSGNGETDQPVIVNVYAPPADGLRSIPLLAVDDPGVTADTFAVVGSVAYAGVRGEAVDGFGYLELATDFESGPPVITRAAAASGPLRIIAGRSGERPFALPVRCGNRRPTRVRVGLVMSGTGTVTLSNLQLTEYTPAHPPRPAIAALTAAPPPWWTRDRTTDTAVGGFGLVGFLALAEPLMRRGRGRKLVLSSVIAVGLLGQLYFAWAMALLGHGEPLRTWSPLLLCAIAGWCVPLSIPVVNRRYRDAELRRMRALDAVAV